MTGSGKSIFSRMMGAFSSHSVSPARQRASARLSAWNTRARAPRYAVLGEAGLLRARPRDRVRPRAAMALALTGDDVLEAADGHNVTREGDLRPTAQHPYSVATPAAEAAKNQNPPTASSPLRILGWLTGPARGAQRAAAP
jgi:hypothetical protein